MSPIFSPSHTNGLVVLSFGAGQDSTAILYRLIRDPKWRVYKLRGSRLVVVFSDTGNEHPETYEHLASIKRICHAYGVEFHHLTPDLGYHSEAWQSLEHQFKTNGTIAMKRVKSCTDNLKIKPIYRWLDHYCSKLLGDESRSHQGKPHIQAFAKLYGPIIMLIGFTAEKNEIKRARKAKRAGAELWWQSIQKEFPLIWSRWSRSDCINYMESTGWKSCPPSNCMMCPNVSKQELIYLWRFHKKEFIRWAKHERIKLKKNATKERNVGALGNQRDLITELRAALNKFGHWSDDQLKEYKHSHGHCISSGL
jgi:3'-phosphoadenosine 5'-phosphosulfate sulfotransferase (PAPS reductase)/FAD synthetase